MLYHVPISLSELVRRFPNCKELFLVHEEYCISHNTNLQELDKAMKNPEFKTCIKVVNLCLHHLHISDVRVVHVCVCMCPHTHCKNHSTVLSNTF